MDKTMLEIKVTTKKDGRIAIEQDWENIEPEMNQRIEITPGQVDILIQWLQEAKAELQDQT